MSNIMPESSELTPAEQDADHSGHPDSSSLNERLLEMPKQAIDDTALSVTEQAKYVMLVGILFPILAGLFHLISLVSSHPQTWEFCSGMMLVIAPSPLVVGFIYYLWIFVQKSKFQSLIEGEYYVHWQIDEEQWSEVVKRAEKNNGWLAPSISLGCVALAEICVFACFLDGSTQVDSPALLFLGVGLGAGVFGAIVGLFCQQMGLITERIMKSRTPQVVIGPQGIYMTAGFFPTKTFGQQLERVVISREHPGHLRMIFGAQARHGKLHLENLVPYPPDENQAATRVCELLMQDLK